MRRIVLVCCAVLVAGCADGAQTAARREPVPTPASASPSASAIPADAVTVALPAPGVVVRATAADGWPVYVVGRADGTGDVFGAIAPVGPDRLGDEVGWCHANGMFEGTTPGRRFDDRGRSVAGQSGLVRYDADVVGDVVVIGARGTQVTDQAAPTTAPSCARRALLTPDYPPTVGIEAARISTTPVRVSGVLVLAPSQPALVCATTRSCGQPGSRTGLELVAPMEAERLGRNRVSIARTFWVRAQPDGRLADVAYGSAVQPDDDVSEDVQWGYLARVEGDWIYFDRAEILLGDAAQAAAKADGVTLVGEGAHYLRNVNPRLRRYRVEAGTTVTVEGYTGTGRSALPALREHAGRDFPLTLVTRNGRLLNALQETCG